MNNHPRIQILSATRPPAMKKSNNFRKEGRRLSDIAEFLAYQHKKSMSSSGRNHTPLSAKSDLVSCVSPADFWSAPGTGVQPALWLNGIE